MATLFNTKISATYPGLLKTIDNAAISATLKQLTDGSGNASGLFLNNSGDFKVTSILEWGSLKDTGTGVTITQFVTAANGIANFNNDTTVPTSAAVKTYVDAVVTASDLDFKGDSGIGEVDLDSELLEISGTTNEIITVALNQKLTIGLPNSVTISGIYTGATFSGDLNGTINTATTAITQTAGNNSTKVATTAYVDSLDAASDLDFSGDSGTGDVTLNTQVLAITGTTNQIVTAAANQGLSLSLPSTVHRNLQGNVTGNVDGDLTGNVTATSVLVNGVSATTQSSSDNSTKVATTAYVKGLDNASDLDITGDTGTGDVNLNTQTLNILGTTNEITTAVVNQTATISLPSSISVDVIGNVTGDLTGNADTATAWETARSLSVTGEATGILLNVNGTQPVSGAVTLDNNSVTAKVLTGLPTPASATVLATDSILDGIGKLQSQINGLANGLQFQGAWNATSNSPVLSSGGGEAANGITTATTANKLVDSLANFTSTVTVGDKVINQVDRQTALVTGVDSNTTLSLASDIMLTGEGYTIDNSPFINQGYYYVVNEGGTTSLNGINTWSVGDWVIAGATNVWEKLDHTDVEGTGTPGNIAKWSATGTIADSIMAESGAAITVTGSLSTTTNLNSGSNFAVATNKFTANGTTGNVAFVGNLAINTNKFTVNATSGNTLIAGTVTSPTFLGDLNGTINTLTTAVTQSANNNSTKVATTAYVDTSAGLYLPLAGGIMTGNILMGNTVVNPASGFSDQTGIGLKYSTTVPTLEVSSDSAAMQLGRSSTGGEGQILGLRKAGVIIHNFDTNNVSIGTTANFTGNVGIGTTPITSPNGADTSLSIFSGQDCSIILKDSVETWEIYQNDDLFFSFGTTPTTVLTLARTTGTATFGGNVIISKSNTAELQLIDTTNNVSLLIGADNSNTFLRNSSGLMLFQTNGGTTALTLSGANATFAGTITSGALTVGSSGTSRFTDTNAFPLQLSRGLDVDSVGANGAVLGIGTIKSGTYKDGVRISGGLETNGTDGNFTLQTLGGGAYTTALTISSSQNATFAGKIASVKELVNIKSANGLRSAGLESDSTGNIWLGTGTTAATINFVTGNSTNGLPSTNGVKRLTTNREGTDVYASYASNTFPFRVGFLNGSTYTPTFVVNDNGNVGIGTTNPGSKLNVLDSTALTAQFSGYSFASAANNARAASGSLRVGNGSGTTGLLIDYTDQGQTLALIKNEYTASTISELRLQSPFISFYTGTTATERMRITSGGTICVGKDNDSFTTPGVNMFSGGDISAVRSSGHCLALNRRGSDGELTQFYKSDTKVGSITVTGSATTYVTNSDYRLKEDLQDFAGLDMVSKIPVYDFKWKTDESRSYGVMAHELKKVLPQAVTGEKDAEEMQSVDYSKIVPLLVKSIQELEARLKILENK